MALERPLGNDLSKTVNSFISHLEIANPSYSIHGFGPFLSDVPQRLEQSEILRASARAFTTSVQAIYSDNSTAVQAIKDYGAAITCLRSAFAKSPKEVKSADTLCGVYLLLLAQVSLPPLLSCALRLNEALLPNSISWEQARSIQQLLIGAYCIYCKASLSARIRTRSRRGWLTWHRS